MWWDRFFCRRQQNIHTRILSRHQIVILIFAAKERWLSRFLNYFYIFERIEVTGVIKILFFLSDQYIGFLLDFSQRWEMGFIFFFNL